MVEIISVNAWVPHVGSETTARAQVVRWRVEWINVLAEDYGAARDMAERLEADGRWIMVPKGHPLDGQEEA